MAQTPARRELDGTLCRAMQRLSMMRGVPGS
eukprot:COSAG02_NODE_19477_length_879_cov_18.147436_1_plen_30_part_01